ncbi:hypothetical protein PC116_g33284, partial [Phytophthora cactorum]
VGHAIFITGVSLALNYGGADMTWIGYFRPILSCPGIIPLALTLCWSGQTRLAAILSPVLGFFTGLAIWLGTAKALYGTINLQTTEAGLPALYGACGSFFSPALYSVLISTYKPYKFDWREFLRIELADEFRIDPDSESSAEQSEESSISDEKKDLSAKNDEKHPAPPKPVYLTGEVQTSSSEEVTKVSSHNAKLASGDTEKDSPKATVSPRNSPTAIPLDQIQHPFSEETLKELR